MKNMWLFQSGGKNRVTKVTKVTAAPTVGVRCIWMRTLPSASCVARRFRPQRLSSQHCMTMQKGDERPDTRDPA